MSEPGQHYAKWNKAVRERQIPYGFTHMWNQWTKKTNKQNRNRFIDTEKRLTAVRGEEGWGLDEKGEGIKKKPS